MSNQHYDTACECGDEYCAGPCIICGDHTRDKEIMTCYYCYRTVPGEAQDCIVQLREALAASQEAHKEDMSAWLEAKHEHSIKGLTTTVVRRDTLDNLPTDIPGVHNYRRHKHDTHHCPYSKLIIDGENWAVTRQVAWVDTDSKMVVVYETDDDGRIISPLKAVKYHAPGMEWVECGGRPNECGFCKLSGVVR